MDAELRIALADDSYLMREAIGQVLSGLEGIEVAAVCSDGDSLLEAVDREAAGRRRHRPADASRG